MAARYIRIAESTLSGATITATSEASAHPATNVASEPVYEGWRTTDASSQKLLIGHSSAKRVTGCAIVAHTLTETATITLRGGSSADPDGGEFEIEIPYRRRTVKIEFPLEVWRYWSLSIDDPDNPALAFDVGLVILGELRSFEGFQLGLDWPSETVNQSLETEYGHLNIGANLFQRARFSATVKTDNAMDRKAVNNFLVALERERTGLLLIPDQDDDDVFYGRLLSDHLMSRTSPDITEFTGLEFVEDSPGRSVFAGFAFPDLDTGAILTEGDEIITTEGGEPLIVE
jgi:hypothetical protein